MVALLEGRVAVVTGVARGLGLEMATALAEAGASICLVDLLDGVEPAAAALAERTGVEAVGVRADVTSPESVAHAFDVAERRLGLPTVLLCAAGIALEADTLDLPLSAWQRVLDVNLNGTLLACQELARRCVAAGWAGRWVGRCARSTPRGPRRWGRPRPGVRGRARAPGRTCCGWWTSSD